MPTGSAPGSIAASTSAATASSSSTASPWSNSRWSAPADDRQIEHRVERPRVPARLVPTDHALVAERAAEQLVRLIGRAVIDREHPERGVGLVGERVQTSSERRLGVADDEDREDRRRGHDGSARARGKAWVRSCEGRGARGGEPSTGLQRPNGRGARRPPCHAMRRSDQRPRRDAGLRRAAVFLRAAGLRLAAVFLAAGLRLAADLRLAGLRLAAVFLAAALRLAGLRLAAALALGGLALGRRLLGGRLAPCSRLLARGRLTLRRGLLGRRLTSRSRLLGRGLALRRGPLLVVLLFAAMLPPS